METSKTKWDDFSKLSSRIIIEGILKTKSLLHIGAGETEIFGPDNPFIKIEYGDSGKVVPYVPGSSIKGVLRAEVERIARKEGKRVCIPPDVCRDPDDLCIVCQIFGSTALASHVRIWDAYPESDDVKLVTKPGIAINRVTGTVHPGHLFTIQAVPPHTKFKFRMIIENIDKKDNRMKFLMKALEALRNGYIQIGGKKSTGMGVVCLEDLRVKEFDLDTLINYGKLEEKNYEDFLKEVFGGEI